MNATDLFRHFAALAATGDAPEWEPRILLFANRYGGLGVTTLVRVPDPQVETCNAHTIGESLSTWWKESYRMRVALGVWDALRADDTAALQRWFTVPTAGDTFRNGTFTPEEDWPIDIFDPSIQLLSDEVVTQWAILHIGVIDPSDRYPGWPSGPVEWALVHLRKWINQQLDLHTTPRLLRVLSAPEKTPLQLGIVPKNLLGAMWLQFARVIEGELQYERCAECGQWFHVKPKGNRSNTRFCRPACRVKANRRVHGMRPKKKAAAGR